MLGVATNPQAAKKDPNEKYFRSGCSACQKRREQKLREAQEEKKSVKPKRPPWRAPGKSSLEDLKLPPIRKLSISSQRSSEGSFKVNSTTSEIAGYRRPQREKSLRKVKSEVLGFLRGLDCEHEAPKVLRGGNRENKKEEEKKVVMFNEFGIEIVPEEEGIDQLSVAEQVQEEPSIQESQLVQATLEDISEIEEEKEVREENVTGKEQVTMLSIPHTAEVVSEGLPSPATFDIQLADTDLVPEMVAENNADVGDTIISNLPVCDSTLLPEMAKVEEQVEFAAEAKPEKTSPARLSVSHEQLQDFDAVDSPSSPLPSDLKPAEADKTTPPAGDEPAPVDTVQDTPKEETKSLASEISSAFEKPAAVTKNLFSMAHNMVMPAIKLAIKEKYPIAISVKLISIS